MVRIIQTHKMNRLWGVVRGWGVGCGETGGGGAEGSDHLNNYRVGHFWDFFHGPNMLTFLLFIYSLEQ